SEDQFQRVIRVDNAGAVGAQVNAATIEGNEINVEPGVGCLSDLAVTQCGNSKHILACYIKIAQHDIITVGVAQRPESYSTTAFQACNIIVGMGEHCFVIIPGQGIGECDCSGLTGMVDSAQCRV